MILSLHPEPDAPADSAGWVAGLTSSVPPATRHDTASARVLSCKTGQRDALWIDTDQLLLFEACEGPAERLRLQPEKVGDITASHRQRNGFGDGAKRGQSRVPADKEGPDPLLGGRVGEQDLLLLGKVDLTDGKIDQEPRHAG